MVKFHYEIKMNVETEQVTSHGSLYYPSTPSVKRKPQGWIKGNTARWHNRQLAKLEVKTRHYSKLDQVIKKLDKRKLKYTKEFIQRQPTINVWREGKFVTENKGEPSTYCVIKSI